VGVSEDERGPRDIYLGSRIDDLREAISASGRTIHERIDRMPDDIKAAVSSAISPLIPEPTSWYQRHPWDKIVVLLVAWTVMILTGAAVAAGAMPDGLLQRLLTVAGSYVAEDPGSTRDVVRGLSEVVTGSPAEADSPGHHAYP